MVKPSQLSRIVFHNSVAKGYLTVCGKYHPSIVPDGYDGCASYFMSVVLFH
jgi:hypothetical protein